MTIKVKAIDALRGLVRSLLPQERAFISRICYELHSKNRMSKYWLAAGRGVLPVDTACYRAKLVEKEAVSGQHFHSRSSIRNTIFIHHYGAEKFAWISIPFTYER